MVSLHIVLWDFAFVLLLLLGQVIDREALLPLNVVHDTMQLFLPWGYSKGIQIGLEYSNRKKSAEIKDFPNFTGSFDSSGFLFSHVTRALLTRIPGAGLTRNAAKNWLRFWAEKKALHGKLRDRRLAQ